MRTVRFHTYGGPEVLTIEETPVPRPAGGELLVEVAAVGVNLPVVRLTRGGPDGAGVPLPHAPGGDVVGRVAAVGAGVTGWELGQRVAALAPTGAYAEYVPVPAALAAPVPGGIDDAAAVQMVRGGQVALGVLRAAGCRAGRASWSPRPQAASAICRCSWPGSSEPPVWSRRSGLRPVPRRPTRCGRSVPTR